MTKDEALKLALEALKQIDEAMPFPVAKLAQAAIKEALANVATEDTSKERVDEMQKQRHEQEPIALPCCGYADASAVKWNPYNQVVQCHNCGQVYTATPQRKPLEGVIDVQPIGYHSLQLIFKSQDEIAKFKAAHGIKE